jgi:hypothetical protein
LQGSDRRGFLVLRIIVLGLAGACAVLSGEEPVDVVVEAADESAAVDAGGSADKSTTPMDVTVGTDLALSVSDAGAGVIDGIGAPPA